MRNMFTEDHKIVPGMDAADGAAGTTDITLNTVDMKGFDSLALVVVMGAITATAVTSIKMQQGEESDMSDAADLSGVSESVADDDDEGIFILDVHKPSDRYVRGVIDRGTANAVVQSAFYVLYNAREVPVTQPSGVTAAIDLNPSESA